MSAQADMTAAAPVQLIYATTVNYGCSSCFQTSGVIEVANLGYAKDVTVVYAERGGPSVEAPAHYLDSPDANHDLFAFDHLAGTDLELSVRYRVGGYEFWDDGGGVKHHVSALSPVSMALGASRDVVVTAARECDGVKSVCVDALVRNRTANKSVRVVWTTDAWATTKTADASYVPQNPGTYAGPAEPWRATLSGIAAANDLEFAIVEEQGGAQAWDNGYGKNFRCARQTSPTEAWTCTGGALLPR